MNEITTPTGQQDQIQAELLDFFKALSNIDRLKVVGLLAVEPLTAAQAAARLGWPLPAAVKHLDNLLHFGLLKVSDPSARQEMRYCLDNDWLLQTSRRVLSGSRPRLSKDDFEGEDFERKVLSEWMTPQGALKALPTQHKKLLVILRHLVKVFEAGQRYPEKQVNEMLKRFNPDFAALRRYMVDEGLLARKEGVYWLATE